MLLTFRTTIEAKLESAFNEASLNKRGLWPLVSDRRW